MIKVQGIYILDEDQFDFPDPEQALADPNGLLAVGGDLYYERLLNAYRLGIFPWFEEAQPILWWSPDPRCVIFPDKLKVSKSLKKSIHNKGFEFRKDTAFEKVIQACRDQRIDEGTWITDGMLCAYITLFEMGYAHSYEIWQHESLVGGLYGIQMGKVFCGESMFSNVTDSSKTALFYLCQEPEIELIDCQIENPHLISLGAENISRKTFRKYL